MQYKKIMYKKNNVHNKNIICNKIEITCNKKNNVSTFYTWQLLSNFAVI
jgi:hypothetical protein